MIVSKNYANAFSEVLEILFCMPKSEYIKIPMELIDVLEEYHNPNYEFYYEEDKTLDEQNVLLETKEIISLIYRDYWADDDKKQKIIENEKKELEILEKEKNEKYSCDNLFKNNTISGVEKEEKKELQIVTAKDNFFIKIFKKIKDIFKI